MAVDEHGGSRGLVLVVEDETAIAELESMYLTREGFTVTVRTSGASAVEAIAALRPVAIVLDIGLPDVDGVDLCRRLRARGDRTPVLFVTARDDEVDRIVGLESGADDYITKPFSPRELVARVKAVLRRGAEVTDSPVVVGSLTLDIPGRRVKNGTVEVALTATEFDLLAYLVGNPGRVYSRDQLLSAVWGYSGLGSRTVDVHVAQLRAKLGDASPIRTVRGVGYSGEIPR